MVEYSFAHLTQAADQKVVGPIQDDEALLLFAMIRTMRLKRILEVGGGTGYSARNFLKAVDDDAAVYSLDIKPITKEGPNHFPTYRDAREVTAEDFDNKPLDLVFFDCHVFDVQVTLFERLSAFGIITPKTVIALHDTNLHPQQFVPWAYQLGEGWVHQKTERMMTNYLKEIGYDVFCFHTEMTAHSAELPYRHGLTIAGMFLPLAV